MGAHIVHNVKNNGKIVVTERIMSRFKLSNFRAMTQPQWTYSSYGDRVPRQSPSSDPYLRYELEPERSAFSRLGSILGFATTVLCMCVIGMIYVLYFH